VLGGFLIALGGEQEVNDLTLFVDSPVSAVRAAFAQGSVVPALAA
jgi:hypothetical protein